MEDFETSFFFVYDQLFYNNVGSNHCLITGKHNPSPSRTEHTEAGLNGDNWGGSSPNRSISCYETGRGKSQDHLRLPRVLIVW
ncbi:hypothetical protein Nepgr_011292 [Nepenthes gracilis]|uniref:Uncharacterized protein n=1 Tax=Nepenthes gracilis TaxID=150966 RepID=A0AAD3XMA0_NEPGR|nr:hypothetical protein Nepgr_011292 [Nepenthes gracilis]